MTCELTDCRCHLVSLGMCTEHIRGTTEQLLSSIDNADNVPSLLLCLKEIHGYQISLSTLNVYDTSMTRENFLN